jgi:hypothetical protein
LNRSGKQEAIMREFANTINALFPALTFLWLGNRTLWVGRPTTENKEGWQHLGYLVRFPHSPCWKAYDTSGRRDDWVWESTLCYSLPAALKAILERKGAPNCIPSQSIGLCLEAENDLLRQEENANLS